MARFFQPKKKTSLNTKHQPVTIDRLDHQGAGIAYLDKKPVFVEGALPGEDVLIQLTESKSKFSRARLIKVVKPSEKRVELFCPYYTECGGCDMQHYELNAQRENKQQTLFQLMVKLAGQNHTLSPEITGRDREYRCRARLSLMWDKKEQQLQFGFRRKQSKQIITVADCAVLEPSLNELLVPLRQLLSGFRSPESLGHVELVKGAEGPVIALRHLKSLAENDLDALTRFAGLHGATLYLLPESNVAQRITGAVPYYDENGVRIPFLPINFIQVNEEVNRRMVAQAMEWLDLSEQDRVLDLFCGVGNFSLPLATRVRSVTGVEGVDEMVTQAKENARLNHIDNVAFYQANLELDVTEHEWAKAKFDKILLDPARAGAAGVVEQLSVLGATRIVYVSCNPATLARDSQSLISQGFELARLGMLDMFPHTSHLESMALFVKTR